MSCKVPQPPSGLRGHTLLQVAQPFRKLFKIRLPGVPAGRYPDSATRRLTDAELRKALRRAAKRLHPDRFSAAASSSYGARAAQEDAASGGSAEDMYELTAAYERLRECI